MCKLNFIKPVTLVSNREMLPKHRSSFKISDREFSFLCDIVSVPVVLLVEQGIFTQGIVDKILNGGSDYQKLYLAHREIVFGMGYDKAWKKMTECIANSLFFKPAIAKVNNPNFSDTKMDVIKTKDDRFNNLDPIKQFSIRFGNQSLDTNMVLDFGIYFNTKNLDTTQKLLGHKQEKECPKNDKDLVFNSFITFVKEELSDDHESDLTTVLEILQDYFNPKELLCRITQNNKEFDESFLGFKTTGGIMLKDIVNRIITIYKINKKPTLLQPAIVIKQNPEYLISKHRWISQQWLLKNVVHLLGYRDLLKTKSTETKIIELDPIRSIKDDAILNKLCVDKAEEIFKQVMDNLIDGKLSYDQVMGNLVIPNIYNENKYNTEYILKYLLSQVNVKLGEFPKDELEELLKYQIEKYQFNSLEQVTKTHCELTHNKIRKQVSIYLDVLWCEAQALYNSTGTVGISRHYKDSDLEMMVSCKIVYDNFGLPIWKTQVEIIRSKHFVEGQTFRFCSLDFHYNQEDYRDKLMKKIFHT